MLLLLAAISISMLSGDNSILRRAKSSVGYNYIGAAKDEVSLAYNSAYAKYLTNRYTEGTTEDDKNLAKLMADELKTHVARNNQKSHECTLEYNETEVSTVKLTYTDDQGTSYTTTGRLNTTVGSESFSWGGILAGTDVGGGSGGAGGGTTLGSIYNENMVGKIINYSTSKSIGDDNKWIILGEDSQIPGNYLITTAKPINTEVQIYYTARDWLDYETKINTACSGFTGTLGSTAITNSRSIKLEDINNVTGYTTEYNSYNFISGDTNDYEHKRVNYWYPSTSGTEANNYFVKSQGTATWNGSAEKLHARYYYYKDGENYYYGNKNNGLGNESITTLNKNSMKYILADNSTYWVASRSVDVSSFEANFYVANVGYGGVRSSIYDLCYSFADGGYNSNPSHSNTFAVRPVVSLSSSIPIEDGMIEGYYVYP